MYYKEYKSINYAAIADEILEFWKKEKIFEKSIEVREGQPAFTFFEGPPSANGTPGIHHVMARSIKDIFCRYKTLKGYQVKRKGGWDTHGLPVELQVEKELGITKDDIGNRNAESYISIEEYNQKCRETVMRFTDQWDNLTEKMGYWVDLENPYITYKNEYIESVWYLLKEFYKKGLLYKGYTIQPYSPAAGTGLSSHELNMPGTYKDIKDTSLTAQFKVLENHKSEFLFELLPHRSDGRPKSLSNREGLDSYPSPMERGRGEVFILAWTTTPWTLPANSALTVGKNINYVLIKTFNPYTFLPVNVVLAKELVGKYFTEKGKDGDFNGFEVSDKKLIPWTIISEFKGSDLDGIEYEQLLPYVQPETAAFRVIMGDFVTTEDGTGVVHTSPTFGADDFRVAQQHGIPSIMVKDETGKDVPIVDKRGRFVKEITDFALEYVKEAYLSDEEKEVERIKQAGGGPHREKYLSVDERIAIKLKTENKAFNVQRYEHTYPHCWRTDKPILYYPLDSWFIRTTAMKDKLVELNKTINWKPESTGTGRFGNWLENLVDWNLSRSRYWGTPLPIWRSEDNEEVCIGSVEELINGLKHALKDEILNEEQRAKNEKFINAYHNSKKSKESPSVVESGVEENITWEHFIYQSNYKDWSNLKNLARENRKNQTQAENIIWQEVRNSKLGFKFRRQHSIDTFIVDFICIEKKLIVEIDGDIHNETIEYDEMRTKFLNLRGFEVIRFSNNEVLTNIRGVIGEINIALKPRRSDGRPKSLSTEEGLDLITVLHPSPVERGRGEVFDLHRPFVDEVYLVSPSGKIMQRELDLIDVWFDSGAMPFAQWHYPFENKEIFDANYPADFISEGVDQTRGWFFTLHAISGMLYDSVAFKNVVSTGLVLDKNGNKMSKRLGNAVDPFETLGKYGADPTRWYMITNAEPWDNLKFNLEGIGEVQRKFFGTLSNTYNFYALYANLDKYKMTEFDRVPYEHLPELDRWIQSKLYTLIKEVGEQYDDYNPTKAGRLIQDFVCDQLSNWYVRLCRRRFWNGSSHEGELTQDKRAAYETLQHCLVTVAQLMSPIAPFYGDWLYKSMTDCIREEAIEKNTPLRHESVHFTDWHIYEENWVDKDLEASMDLAQSISSLIHSLRKTHKIKVRQPLQRVLIPVLSENTRKQIRHVEEIIKSEVNIKSIEYIDDDSATSVGGFLKKKVKPNFKTLGPKYGKDMKEVGNFINSMSAEQLKELEKNGELPTHSGTGGEPPHSFTHLKLEDVEIQTEDVPGWLVASDNGITVALDITISDELRQEGIARDFVNRIQNYRKDNGFEVTNKINIQLWNNNQALANAIDANREYISQEVQALSLKIFEEYPLGEKPTNAVEIEMDEFMLVLSVDVEK
ncbi:class I tRNA ligase family protein [Emticicia sp.]|uniref:class I tRNA ligase family protein n=1 Tax=Emticicia sp. TaxID=1930953 RepID=UPI00375017A4